MTLPEVRKKSRAMKLLAEKIIDENEEFSFIKDNEIRICYLLSNKEKKSDGGIVHGECEKIADKYKWAIPFDFSITFYELNNIDFTKEQLEILMKHELMHIGQDDKGNLKIVPHDIQDFSEILVKHGLFWDSKIDDN